jgi:hypothetical protein
MARSRAARRRRRELNKERRERVIAKVVEEGRADRRVFEFMARGGIEIKFDFTEDAKAVVEVDTDEARKLVST